MRSLREYPCDGKLRNLGKDGPRREGEEASRKEAVLPLPAGRTRGSKLHSESPVYCVSQGAQLNIAWKDLPNASSAAISESAGIPTDTATNQLAIVTTDSVVYIIKRISDVVTRSNRHQQDNRLVRRRGSSDRRRQGDVRR